MLYLNTSVFFITNPLLFFHFHANCNTFTSSYSFRSQAYSLSRVDEWLPAIIQNSSTKSLPLSSISSFVFVAKAFLDEDDREDAVLFQLIIFWAGSAQIGDKLVHPKYSSFKNQTLKCKQNSDLVIKCLRVKTNKEKN